MNKEELKQLLERYLAGQCNESERALVECWYNEYKEDHPANVPTAEIEEDLRAVLTLLPIPNHRQTIPWVRYVTVAAAIMLVVGFYVFMIHPNLAESSKFTETPKNEDITPGGNKATLILADGQEILLDDVANGNIAQQGGNLVYKNSDGRLIYKTGEYEGDYGDDIPMNTITTPRGGQYDITLPDGTKVWINAASSLTYAVTNSGNERIVKLKGEGYFEVAKVNDKPFKVLTDNQTVEVLGTHFNINSYLDEPTIKTTLIEGSVKIMEHTTQHTVTLKPGQQASLDDKNHLSVKQVNVVDAIAWKSGLFRFENSDIETIMRQFARWYDVEVEFEGQKPDIQLWGEAYRNVNASNPAVVDVVITSLRKEISKNPSATYWSVSQNDNDQYCRCDACVALDEKYGSVPSGSIIYFVNQVAKAFRDKIISTLAYWYSRKAPKNIKPEPNVNIMLCNIESKRHGPVFETDPAFSNDLKDWGSLTSDILIWDYNIQFTNFFAPFPNLHTIKPNIKFYTDHHVNALYMQSNSEAAAEMAVLRAYLIYKLMWDPDADENVIIDDFLTGYYGAAGRYIRQYIDALHQSLLKSGIELKIFGDPVDAKNAFLSTQMMEEYKRLFDQAEAAVSTDAQLLQRVQVARLPIMFAEIQIGRTEIDTPRSLYHHIGSGIAVAKPEMKALVNQFVTVCKREGVRLVRERAGSPDHFLAAYNRIFTNMEEMDKVKSFHKKIIPITHPSSKSKGVEGLTDGVFASYESWQVGDANWIFYEGEHMDFILDLGEVMSISSINMDFLNPQAQPDWHLMALPKYVSYAISADGEQYNEPIVITNPHNPNPFENPGISRVSMHSFQADINEEIRYVKVHAENLLKMPSWHIRTGGLTCIYSDQIVVK